MKWGWHFCQLDSKAVFPKCFQVLYIFQQTMAFFLNVSLNSVTKRICQCNKRAWTFHLLCKRPGCYHSAGKTHVRNGTFKLGPIHASVIYQIPWIYWIQFLFYFGKLHWIAKRAHCSDLAQGHITCPFVVQQEAAACFLNVLPSIFNLMHKHCLHCATTQNHQR